jgi:hypothetical protein
MDICMLFEMMELMAQDFGRTSSAGKYFIRRRPVELMARFILGQVPERLPRFMP